MQRTKFRENWSAGSGDKDFLRIFTIYGRSDHRAQVTQML